MTPHNTCTIGILGEGLAGIVAALGLAKYGHRIILSRQPLPRPHDASLERPIALSKLSIDILASLLSLSPEQLLSRLGHCQMRQIHVSEKGHLNRVLLHCQQHNLPYFGAVVSATSLLSIFREALSEVQNIKTLPISTLEKIPNGYRLEHIENDEPSIVDMVVIADGASSHYREKLGFETVLQPYAEVALTGLVQVQSSETNAATAFERFSPDGPIAMLPFTQNRYAYVCTAQPNQLETPEQILTALQTRFGQRLGHLSNLEMQGRFPLSLHYSRSLTQSRAVLLGNAALSVHPIAGQGYNLVVKDIAWLIEHLGTPERSITERLERYADARAQDHQITRYFTHSIVSTFALPWLRAPRGLGLGLLNLSPTLRRLFVSLGSGRTTALPKLAFAQQYPHYQESLHD